MCVWEGGGKWVCWCDCSGWVMGVQVAHPHVRLSAHSLKFEAAENVSAVLTDTVHPLKLNSNTSHSKMDCDLHSCPYPCHCRSPSGPPPPPCRQTPGPTSHSPASLSTCRRGPPPTANTSISRLYLPMYSSKQLLRTELLQAVTTKDFRYNNFT